MNNPTLGEFCFTMIGRADIEGSKSNVAMNAWLPQASYPCGTVAPTPPQQRGRAPLAPGRLGLSSRGCLSAGPDSILRPAFRCTGRRGPHRHLVSEGCPWARSLVCTRAPVGPSLRIAQSPALLPYPRSLPGPPPRFRRRLGSWSSQGFPAIRRCRRTPGLAVSPPGAD